MQCCSAVQWYIALAQYSAVQWYIDAVQYRAVQCAECSVQFSPGETELVERVPGSHLVLKNTVRFLPNPFGQL